jgi:hypothetical protein
MENTPFGGFSAGLRRPNQLAAVGGILVFGGSVAIFAELEFAGLDFSTCSIGRPKGQTTPHANLGTLRPSVAAE